jgi:hypothetical protein
MGEGRENSVQQLATKVIVTPITNRVCNLCHLVTTGTDIFLLISDITHCLVKGKG